jgi:peptide/nickel transport system substrate-binding protein
MTRRRKARRVICLVTIASLASAACAGTETASDSDILKVIIRAPPTSFDPRVGTDEQSQRVHQLIYSELMTVDSQLRVAPGLAARLENPDPLTYIAYLRSGVRFHDGHALTARDVVYTFASFLDPDFVSARRDAYWMLASVRALDDHRVEFKLKEPFGPFPHQLVMPVVPDGAGDSMQSFPIGTGPYRFVRYLDDEQIDLSAFEGYWDGLPQNAGVVLRIIPDDTMRGLELLSGSADLTINDVTPDIAYQLQQEGLTITEGQGVDYAYIGLNMRDAVLRDKRVRHAIGYAIDRQSMIDHLRRGLATPAWGVLSPLAWEFEPDVHHFDYDVSRATELLDDAGYPDPDGDGPLPRLRLSLKTSAEEFYRLQAAVIQENLRLVGIALDVRSDEFATLDADVLSGNVQMFMLEWVGVTDPDMLRRLFHSDQVPPIGFNRVHYSNPEVDRLIDMAMRAPTDADRRLYYSAVQKSVAEDAPYISLWHRTNIAVTRPNITGMRLSAQADFMALKDVKKEH